MLVNKVPVFDVLIVDDEPGDVDLTRMALTQGPFQCQIHVANNGADAMDYLTSTAGSLPDLMILDMNMPRKNGQEVLAEMKANPALAAVPVVVLTTSDAEVDVMAAYKLGASGFLTKPVDPDAFFKMILGVQQYWFGLVRRPLRAL